MWQCIAWSTKVPKTFPLVAFWTKNLPIWSNFEENFVCCTCEPGGLVAVCWHEDLLQLGLGLDGLHPLLLDVAVGRLPHEEVLDNVLHGFPGQKVFADVVKVFAVLVDRLLKEVGLGRAPVLHFVAAKHRT